MWISDQMTSKVWDEIIHPFANFNGGNNEVSEWISNLTRHFKTDMHIYLCWELISSMLVNGALVRKGLNVL